jgi:hypothetical protein
MKNQLYIKCKTYDFEKLFAQKGYAYFKKGNYNLNIIGVRSNNDDKVTNKYDDYLVIIYNTENGWKRQIYTITTEPGLKLMLNPTNHKGTAILAPGQYRGTYKIDKHNGKYDALCQRNKPVKVYRDNNRNAIYDYNPNTIDTGMFGINIHRSNEFWTRATIDQYSAGCQVFNDPKEFTSFMNLVKKSASIYGNCFTYTLITEDELDNI